MSLLVEALGARAEQQLGLPEEVPRRLRSLVAEVALTAPCRRTRRRSTAAASSGPHLVLGAGVGERGLAVLARGGRCRRCARCAPARPTFGRHRGEHGRDAGEAELDLLHVDDVGRLRPVCGWAFGVLSMLDDEHRLAGTAGATGQRRGVRVDGRRRRRASRTATAWRSGPDGRARRRRGGRGRRRPRTSSRRRR